MKRLFKNIKSKAKNVLSIFTGAGVAIVTPFHADGSVNYEKFAEQIDYQVENGTDKCIITDICYSFINNNCFDIFF